MYSNLFPDVPYLNNRFSIGLRFGNIWVIKRKKNSFIGNSYPTLVPISVNAVYLGRTKNRKYIWVL